MNVRRGTLGCKQESSPGTGVRGECVPGEPRPSEASLEAAGGERAKRGGVQVMKAVLEKVTGLSPWARVTAGMVWWHVPVPGMGLSVGLGGPRARPDPAAAVGYHRRLRGEKASQSGWEADVSCHGNRVWKHHQNVSNEGN